MKLRITTAVAGFLTGAVMLANPAMAAPPAGTTGYDESPNVVLAGGSDTTFFVSNLITSLYNQSPGCATNNTTALYDACVAGQTAPANYANWDHDVIAYPYGSGSGRNALGSAALVTNAIDLARSSSGIGGTAATNSLYEFASEGIAVVAVNPGAKLRTTGTLNVTQAQLQAIYNTASATCTAVTWAQLGDTGPNSADPVLPFGMNSASGTFGSFNTFVGGTANTGACVVGTPFENDVSQLKSSAPVDLLTRYNSGQGLWWISGATQTAFPNLSATLSPMNVNSVSYTTTTGYPLRRNVSYVARDADAQWTVGGLAGAGVGKAGAVREFLRFLCRTTNHTVDLNTQGKGAVADSYVTRISGAIQQSGFSTSVGGTNTAFGRCKASD
jgi:hypothetical protein